MASTTSEGIRVRWLSSELHVDISLATPLFCDNEAANYIANNLVFHERNKHVETVILFKNIESKQIIPLYINNKM